MYLYFQIYTILLWYISSEIKVTVITLTEKMVTDERISKISTTP